jgi:hypothetical protein
LLVVHQNEYSSGRSTIQLFRGQLGSDVIN